MTRLLGPFKPNSKPAGVQLYLSGYEVGGSRVNVQLPQHLPCRRDYVNQGRGGATQKINVTVRASRNVTEAHEPVAGV